ncbi:MAG: hypothetical protein K2M90_02295, partial [Treponemataceae bacterium]|nr:hypothetical protein [Treponemataceae bacterium]
YCTAGNSHTIKNCEIKNNSAAYGSAIYNEYGSLDLQGCIISGNETGTSGTVYIGQASAILTMSDVRIESNSATNGGAVFLGNKATAKISDASVVIKNNSASGGNSRGPGISLWNGYLELSGSAKIEDVVGAYGDNSTYAHEIVISGALTGSTPVATITPSAYAAGTQVLSLASGTGTTLAANCGKFELSQAGWKIDGEGKLAVSPDMYVSEGGDDTSGKGSQSKPFATLQKAFDLIQTLNLSTVSYTVHISGTVKGKSELPADVSAQKISITGTAGADTDVINEGSIYSNNKVITVNSAVPVEITDVKLTGGNCGIAVGSGANVTLGEGAVISGNKMGTSVSSVGGVYISGGTFILSGGTISDNQASSAGGVFIYSDGIFTMKSGSISKNKATSGGGGVYVSKGTFIMEGGTIDANTGGSGAGVFVSTNGTFNISGSASIPAGDGGTNDVYLASGKTITVAGALTAASPVATITLPNYTAGTQVLSAGDDVTLDGSICNKFAVTLQADGTGWRVAPNNDGTDGVLAEIDTIYLDYYGSNANLGLTASGAVNRLSTAIELYDAY